MATNSVDYQSYSDLAEAAEDLVYIIETAPDPLTVSKGKMSTWYNLFVKSQTFATAKAVTKQASMAINVSGQPLPGEGSCPGFLESFEPKQDAAQGESCPPLTRKPAQNEAVGKRIFRRLRYWLHHELLKSSPPRQ